MMRIPAGYSWGPYFPGERVGLTGGGIQSMSSATWAPSRGVPSLSRAATQAWSGIAWIAVCTGTLGGKPDGLLQSGIADVVQERFRRAAGIGAHQHLAPLVVGQLCQRRR